MNQKAAISKELNAKHTKILEGLLKLPENRECADCKNKAPRWASINLGIFICLQCSGIHRSLGVHISKVRSATLDTWLPEQVAYMQRMGNEKSNAYWEAELPLHYNRSRFESFIREKYADRRWVPRDSKVKSPPNSEDGLASPPSSTSESSCSITEFLANQKIIKEHPQVEKETCLKTKLTSADPEVHKNSSEDRATQVTRKDSQMTEQLVLKDQSVAAATVTVTATATAVPVEKPSKVDYATELFRMLWVDDSTESDSSPSSSTSAWVDFDTDEEETTQEKNVKRSSDNKVHPEPKIRDVGTSMVPETKEFPQEHQKETNTVSGISLQGIQQQPVTTSQAPYLNGRITRTINQSPGTHLQMLNIPPEKFTTSITPYTTSSLYRPAVAVNGLSTTTPTKTPPAALPVSGYDYDFSYLTQGMFTK